MTNNTNFNASAPLAGYLFQCRLALLRGLQLAKKKSNGQISIEKFDDIAYESDDTAQCLIQAKHNIVPKSLDDKSVDVWKTLRIWVAQSKESVIANSGTSLFLITTSIAADGSAMSMLRSDATDESRQTARNLLTSAAKESDNQTTAKARAEFLKLTDVEKDALLARIEVFDKHPNLIDTMEEIEGELLIAAPSHTKQAAQYLEGWWFGQIAPLLVTEENAVIPVQNIIVKASEIGRMFGPDALPLNDPEQLRAKEYTLDDEKEVFVRQMRLAQVSEEVVKRGAKDFYRAAAQRSRWARESLLLDGEASQYDQRITDSWARKRDEIFGTTELTTEANKEIAARQLLFWATQQSVAFRNIIEVWITSGSFHGLADRKAIGWHPDFVDLLSEEISDDAA